MWTAGGRVHNPRIVMIAVVGAGVMGRGIAQVAAAAGDTVLLYDAATGVAATAAATIDGVTAVDELSELAGAHCVVEAIAEDLGVKQALFADLARVTGPDCLLATNTSSLSPTAIAAAAPEPRRVIGLHFFNPPPVMQLVEVVPGAQTDTATLARTRELAQRWGKTVVEVEPTPGFLVNRIARPFYAEAWRIVEERAAAPEVVDAVLTRGAGFRIGPFALMDLIGHDVNLAVTRSVWENTGYDPRYRPSFAQQELVAAGRLGRKSGRGVYSYGAGRPDPPPMPSEAAVEVGPGGELPSGGLLVRCDGRSATALSAASGRPVAVYDRAEPVTALAIGDGAPDSLVAEATGALQTLGLAVHRVDDIPGLIVTRTVAALVNAAVDALHAGTGSAADIDTAMRLGTGYPRGPLEWGDEWGAAEILTVLDNLSDSYRDARHRASPLLRRRAASGKSLLVPDADGR